MKINIIRGDLLSVSCDAYVNPTDVYLSGSDGLDRIIHQRGGEALEQECNVIREKMKTGSTEITAGGNLPVKYVLHTACPGVFMEKADSYDLLRKCCTGLLKAAAGKPDIFHLAMPLIGTGCNGYSLEHPQYADSGCSLTAVTILSAINDFRTESYYRKPDEITIVCSSEEKFREMENARRWIFGTGISTRERVKGSLLGGAAGDALGYPFEFVPASYGMVQGYVPNPKSGKAEISDDTQMTLFTACGLLYGITRGHMRGISGQPWVYIASAYTDWLKTQDRHYEKKKMEISWIRNIPELNANRAPGNTCLSALAAGGGNVKKPINNSKGCGGVMRIAPVALYGGAHWLWGKEMTAEVCAETAAITHGHPLGWLSAAALGIILFDVMRNYSLEYAVEDAVSSLQEYYGTYPDTAVMIGLIRKAGALAKISRSIREEDVMTELQIVKELGRGWVGEEALAVGLFCALAAQTRGLEWCLRSAAGHIGDSDSTASIAGQIWGAYYGENSISEKWLKDLELRDVIEEIADDLVNDCRMDEFSTYVDPAWSRKYLSGPGASHIREQCEDLPHRYIQLPWSEESLSRVHIKQHGGYAREYDLVLEGERFLHVARKKEDVQMGMPGLGDDHADFDEKRNAYVKGYGSVKKHNELVYGSYHTHSFTLIPNYVENCVEIFTENDPNPWCGRIRRRFDEWNNPIEIEYRDGISAVPREILMLLALNDQYLQGFFRR